jgi:hypothetical protein
MRYEDSTRYGWLKVKLPEDLLQRILRLDSPVRREGLWRLNWDLPGLGKRPILSGVSIQRSEGWRFTHILTR